MGPRATILAGLLVGIVVAGSVGLAQPRQGAGRRGVGPEAAVLAARRSGDEARLAEALHALALHRLESGRPPTALPPVNESLALYAGAGMPTETMTVLLTKARILSETGRTDLALLAVERAKELAEGLDDASMIGYPLLIEAWVAFADGQWERAADAAERAAEINGEAGRVEEAVSACQVWAAATAVDDPGAGRSLLLEVLSYLEDDAYRPQRAELLVQLSQLERDLGMHGEALEHAVEAHEAAEDRASALTLGDSLEALALAQWEAGEVETAIELLEGAVHLGNSRRMGLPLARWAASLGFLYEATGQTEDAVRHYRTSVAAGERAMRAKPDQIDHAVVASKRTDAYLGLIRLALADRDSELAFQLSEAMRAQRLSSMLALRDLELGDALSADLLDRKSALEDEQQSIAEQLAGTVLSDVERDDLVERLVELDREEARLDAQIRRESPRVARVLRPEPMEAAAVADLLPAGSVFLSYVFIEERRIVAFAIPAGGAVIARSIVVEDDPDSAARRLRDAIADRDPVVEEYLRRGHDALIEPVTRELEGCERVIVSLDGPLHYVPFGALTSPEGERLVERMAVSLAASATVHAQLIQAEEGRPEAPASVLAVGDPYYEPFAEQRAMALAGMEGHRGGGRHAPPLATRGTRGSMSRWGPGARLDLALPRLPYSGEEALRVSEHFPGAAQALLGVDATEAAVRLRSRGHGFVHIGAHGWLNPADPTNSALVLTPGDGAGTPGPDDGLLQVREIFGLDLNADLVTLSACQSALGANLRGEGLLGMTQAFTYAGAPSVIASLWPVDDEATSVLMSRLYASLADGAPKDEALAHAMAATAADPEFSHPYYWAAFGLYGLP
jgi:CHAT domain-containing protein